MHFRNAVGKADERGKMKKTIGLCFVILLALISVMTASGFVSVAKADDEIVDYSKFAYTAPAKRNKLYGAPTVVYRPEKGNSVDEIDLYSDERPSNVVLSLDENLDVIAENGEKIGSFEEVRQKLKKRVIPIAEIKTQTVAEAFVNKLSSYYVYDLTIMSADRNVLFYVRKQLPYARGVLDCSGEKSVNKSVIVKNSTASMATVVLLSAETADLDTVAYFQSRLKTVWVKLSGSADDFDVKNAVASGCYGLVGNYKAIYNAYSSYVGGSMNAEIGSYVQPSVARYPINVAHRGLPYDYAENTVEGCLAAYNAGATHIEIDARLSKDGEIVVMHDSNLSRTTDYEGSGGEISQMTLAEIKKYRVCRTIAGAEATPCEIPAAEDFFKAFEKTSIVVVFEIKSVEKELVARLRELIEKYDFRDKLVVISFTSSVLEEMRRVLPEIPTATLSGFAPENFETDSRTYNAMNAVPDMVKGSLSSYAYFESALKDRGYMSFGWTFDNPTDSLVTSSTGVFGITNNCAAAFGKETCRISGAGNQSKNAEEIAVGKPVKVSVTSYSGVTVAKDGTIFAVKKYDDHAEVIAAYEEYEKVTYTRAFRVDYKKGCRSSVDGGVALTVSSLAALAFLKVFFAKRKSL